MSQSGDTREPACRITLRAENLLGAASRKESGTETCISMKEDTGFMDPPHPETQTVALDIIGLQLSIVFHREYSMDYLFD